MSVTLLIALCYAMSGIKSLETDFKKVNMIWCVPMNYRDFSEAPFYGKCYENYICKTTNVRFPDVKPRRNHNYDHSK